MSRSQGTGGLECPLPHVLKLWVQGQSNLLGEQGLHPETPLSLSKSFAPSGLEGDRVTWDQDPDGHWHGKHVSRQLAAGSHFPLGSGLAQAHTSSLLYHSLTFSLSWRLRFAGSQNGPHAQEQLPTAQSKPSLLAHQFQSGNGQGESPTPAGPPT